MDYMYVDRIRIYLNNDCTPIAECHFMNGDVVKVFWNKLEVRETMLQYTNGYTLFYDERPKVDWK
ncbi:hypothetical protein [uncultured Clostridium sp.]|uniref:hypothetical protein n=1 Tax=uncultured Clostridium sp. TaxID=59620 RepID=UPI003217A8E1